MKETTTTRWQDSTSAGTDDKKKRGQQLNRDRQKRYRQRALKDPDGLGYSRLQVMLSAHADACLDRVLKATGKTKKEVIEQALIELEARILTEREG